MTNWSASGDALSLVLDPNPLTEFVELPDDKHKLNYSNMLCGVIRGALEMVRSDVLTPSLFFSTVLLICNSLTQYPPTLSL